jgi:amino acid transporter
MFEFIKYYWLVISNAFSGAWGIANTVSFIVSIVCGFIVWKKPTKETAMKHLPWIVPTIFFVICFIISMSIVAPYRIYQGQQQKIYKLQKQIDNLKVQEATNTKRAIRDFLEAIDPEILRSIDAGDKIIRVHLGYFQIVRLEQLSKYPDFNEFLSYQEIEKTAEDPTLIREFNTHSTYRVNYYNLTPTDALIK